MSAARIAAALLLALAPLAAPPAAAQRIVLREAKAVADKSEVTLDPAKAYILYRAEAQLPLAFARVPGPEDLEKYRQLRAEAFQDVLKAHEAKLRIWEREVKEARARRLRPPPQPVEPAEANFAYPSYEELTMFGMGPVDRFAKTDGSVYLHEVTPGDYRLYGAITFTPGQPPTGMCFCMGSVRFEAKAGEITDLGLIGDVEVPLDNAPAKIGQMFGPAPEGSVDPRLANAAVRPARFRPAGKLPNYYGLAIARVPQMAGVMRYERDRIVDLTGE